MPKKSITSIFSLFVRKMTLTLTLLLLIFIIYLKNIILFTMFKCFFKIIPDIFTKLKHHNFTRIEMNGGHLGRHLE